MPYTIFYFLKKLFLVQERCVYYLLEKRYICGWGCQDIKVRKGQVANCSGTVWKLIIDSASYSFMSSNCFQFIDQNRG